MSKAALNDYANSMFRFERFNDAWLNSCTKYIQLLFGDAIKGKTVVDYAFGRGNWSLAFIAAGAKEVISIDASHDNVQRFTEYCKNAGITNIKIINGNVLLEDIKINCDVLWLYGILPMFEEFDVFMHKVKPWMNSIDSLIYVYYYNSNSLRELIVEFCRKLYIYSDEKEFIGDNYLFLRSAKNRASDDLVAPYIGWKTANEFANDLQKNGLYVKSQDIDFVEFFSGVKNKEFYPHQFMCSQNSHNAIQVKEPVNEYSIEFDALNQLMGDINTFYTDTQERKKISVGLFNLHFAYIADGRDINASLIEVFLFLMRLLIQAKAFKQVNFNGITEKYYQLLLKAMSDTKRDKEVSNIGSNLFTTYLGSNRVRL